MSVNNWLGRASIGARGYCRVGGDNRRPRFYKAVTGNVCSTSYGSGADRRLTHFHVVARRQNAAPGKALW